MELDLDQLKELMRSVTEFDIRELEVERDGERIVLRRGNAGQENIVVSAPAAPAMAAAHVTSQHNVVPAQEAGGAAAVPEDPSISYITSPFVGTFYRSPSPEAASFVEEGQTFKTGQVLCIIEAMKLMNEIEADVSGTLVSVLAENGKPVEYGDRLFKIKKG